jgi:hypothetical protein
MTRYATAFSLVLALSGSILLASPARKGCTEGSISVLTDVMSTHEEDELILGGSLGYYVTDRFQIGGMVQRESVEFESFWGYGAVWSLGVFGEYELTKGTSPLTPFVAASVQMLSETDNDNVLVCSLSPGLKIFVTETCGFAAQANFSAATDDIYDFQRVDEATGKGKNYDMSATFSLRFLFF